MNFLIYISDYIIPFVFFYIICMGLSSKTPVYDEFIEGAKDGFRVVKDILPTLIGLMVGVGILRASGALDMLSGLLAPITGKIGLAPELLPLVLVKMFSSSAATGLLLDIFKEYGPDSYFGRLASIILSSTETIFYIMAVYFMAAGVTKTRYTLAGALTATLAGTIASVIITNLVF